MTAPEVFGSVFDAYSFHKAKRLQGAMRESR